MFACFESPLTRFRKGQGTAPSKGMFYSTASSRSLPRKPRPWRKRLLYHSLKPRLPEKRASFWPAGAGGQHEEGENGGGDGIHAVHAIKLGLVCAELLLHA